LACACAVEDGAALATDPLQIDHLADGREVHLKYVRVLEVRAFGARPDDEGDDTAAIQAAIDAASAVPGSTVRLEPGTYRVSEREPLDWNALRVDHGRELAIVGAGPGQTQILFDSERDAHVIAFTDCVNVTLQGLSIDGQRANHRLGHGIRVANADGLTLRMLEINHAAHYGIGLQRGALRRIVIDQVEIHDTGADGIDFNNEWSANEELSISGIFISAPSQLSPQQAGIDVRGSARISAVTVVDVPAGAVGIRLRGDGELSGLGAHHSTLSDFNIAGDPGSVGVAVDANEVRVERGSIAGARHGLRVHGVGASVRDVEVAL
jgi:hypothetical protein